MLYFSFKKFGKTWNIAVTYFVLEQKLNQEMIVSPPVPAGNILQADLILFHFLRLPLANKEQRESTGKNKSESTPNIIKLE